MFADNFDTLKGAEKSGSEELKGRANDRHTWQHHSTSAWTRTGCHNYFLNLRISDYNLRYVN